MNVQAQIDQTKTSIVEAAGNIKLLQTEQHDFAKRIAIYEARIQAGPLNERAMGRLAARSRCLRNRSTTKR